GCIHSLRTNMSWTHRYNNFSRRRTRGPCATSSSALWKRCSAASGNSRTRRNWRRCDRSICNWRASWRTAWIPHSPAADSDEPGAVRWDVFSTKVHSPHAYRLMSDPIVLELQQREQTILAYLSRTVMSVQLSSRRDD